MLMLSCNLVPSSNVIYKSLLAVIVKVLFAHLANRARFNNYALYLLPIPSRTISEPSSSKSKANAAEQH
jgi:hypothetical protein